MRLVNGGSPINLTRAAMGEVAPRAAFAELDAAAERQPRDHEQRCAVYRNHVGQWAVDVSGLGRGGTPSSRSARSVRATRHGLCSRRAEFGTLCEPYSWDVPDDLPSVRDRECPRSKILR